MKKGYVIVSTDEYKGIPVQKCRLENGNIMYHSCSTWFEDFADFSKTVDDSVKEEASKQDSYNGRNDFMDWIVNTARRNESAARMLAAYNV